MLEIIWYIVLEALSGPIERLLVRLPGYERFRNSLRHRLLYGSTSSRIGCGLLLVVGSAIVAVAMVVGLFLMIHALLAMIHYAL